MRFDLKTTVLTFAAIIILATVAVSAMPMTARTVYMMVVPSMIAFGLIMLVLGIKHGEHRAGN